MYDSLLEWKESLQEMAISQSADIESAIKRILLDDVFWDRVTSLRILKSIAAAIAQIEYSDTEDDDESDVEEVDIEVDVDEVQEENIDT
ncbi:hypothetical protein SKAU_G00248460 [Synaphobranchus kaupii]|uniref:Uncharacterized protein n=1 Tax=Synaphobranchus kaupii TaxID=118154 RepID=A0A9Q1IQQ2_SYNKA|nr:hypothetical protein SKAU_G00248460 [Synaphobranchus kaupii]